ncbi:MAG: DUF4252 domain-containing protein [Cyclobacteriaceae bacterium]|jgi:hypothetical protein|nr:DUF4252 domain-containing protein [Cyclobacteriaceae bacterium]
MQLTTVSALMLWLLAILATPAHAQTQTTEKLSKRFGESLNLYFYKNTLRMLNQKEDKDFDALIKDVEKMRFLMIDKGQQFSATEYKRILSDYRSENYEEMMTSRHEGKSFDVYIREVKGDVKGTVILVNDSTNLYVLDILGKVAINKAASLFNALDDSSDIGKKIKEFTKSVD